MLATCSRVSEISRARWEHVDFDAGTWRIPAENAKNGKEHVVFLSEFARTYFEALRDLAAGSPWVLPASRKDGHVCPKALAKQVADRQRGSKNPIKKRSKETNTLALPRGKWTPHDLRRSGATIMGMLGVRPDVIERSLNHAEANPMKRVYQHQKLEAEQREAWRLLGERLELLTGKQTNVVLLPARAG
jgi:integrase